jgi:hypothetical protein
VTKLALLSAALCVALAAFAVTALAPVAPASAATKYKAKAKTKPKPKKPKKKPKPKPKPEKPQYYFSFDQTRTIDRIVTCPNHDGPEPGETVTTGTEILQDNWEGIADGNMDKTESLQLGQKQEVVSGADDSAMPFNDPGVASPESYRQPADTVFKISPDGKTATFTYPGPDAKPATSTKPLPTLKGAAHQITTRTDGAWVSGIVARGSQGCTYREEGQNVGSYTVARVK